jgi:hypothetical protein
LNGSGAHLAKLWTIGEGETSNMRMIGSGYGWSVGQRTSIYQNDFNLLKPFLFQDTGQSFGCPFTPITYNEKNRNDREG